jgi:excisionase family DNA binding protein
MGQALARGFRSDPELSTPPRFYSVAEVARIFGMSEMTVYRAISAGEFPAIRIRGRLIIPARAIEAMTDAAVDGQTVVDAADWVPSQPFPITGSA